MDGLRISELAHRVGVSTSTVRYYERIGLVPVPNRTASGYRDYDARAEARLLFITRGKRMGLSLEEIAELMTIWDGTNCGATKDRLVGLLDDKCAEIAEQIRELQSFETQLADVQASITASPTPDTCDTDLGCCAPELRDVDVTIGIPRSTARFEVVVGEPVPIACTLSATERPGREAALKSLLTNVASCDRTKRSLRLRFKPDDDIESQVEALTAQESECCAFLTFETRRDTAELIWEITAPSDVADIVLDEFAALVPDHLTRRACQR